MPKMKNIKKMCSKKQLELQKIVRDVTNDRAGCNKLSERDSKLCIEANYTEPMHEIQKEMQNAGCPNLKKK